MTLDTQPLYAIGEVARRAGVSTRTLRYYQELGLIEPAGVSEGGNRRYSEAEVARLERILELRNVLGFDLERIGEILAAEDRLAEMRAEAQRGVSNKRKREILVEAIEIDERLRAQVAQRIAVLDQFDADLVAHLERILGFARELGAEAIVEQAERALGSPSN